MNAILTRLLCLNETFPVAFCNTCFMHEAHTLAEKVSFEAGNRIDGENRKLL